MKKEILRMEQLLYQENGTPILDYLSMQIFQGSVFGVLCLEQPGIDKMIELIMWNRPIEAGQVFFDGQLVNRPERCDYSRNRVAVVGRRCRLIDELSLADNLFVIRPGFRRFIVPEKVIWQETYAMLEDLQIVLSPHILVKEMGNYDRLVAEILRAVVTGEKLIILWEISDLLSSEELPRFHQLIRKLTEKGHTFLYIYSHHEVLLPACDQLAVFVGGRIAKVFRDLETAREHVTKVFGRYAYGQIMKLQPDESEDFAGKTPVLELKNISTDNIKNLSIRLRPRENVLLLDQSNTILDDLMRLLAGEEDPRTGEINPPGVTSKKNRQIGLIARDPVNSTLFPEMSFLDNLCFALDDKAPFFWQKSRFRESVRRECREIFGNLLEAPTLYNLPEKDLYTLVYYKYLLSRPKVVVCHQPLADSDMHMRLHILNLLFKLRNSGIAILVLNTELYDTLHIADRLIQVENGRIIQEHTRTQFDEVRMLRRDLFPD